MNKSLNTYSFITIDVFELHLWRRFMLIWCSNGNCYIILFLAHLRLTIIALRIKRVFDSYLLLPIAIIDEWYNRHWLSLHLSRLSINYVINTLTSKLPSAIAVYYHTCLLKRFAVIIRDIKPSIIAACLQKSVVLQGPFHLTLLSLVNGLIGLSADLCAWSSSRALSASSSEFVRLLRNRKHSAMHQVALKFLFLRMIDIYIFSIPKCHILNLAIDILLSILFFYSVLERIDLDY